MNWTSVNDQMPNTGDRVWYFFSPVGVWQGVFDGYHDDDLDLHIFTCSETMGWLTGDVTHWMPDVGQTRPARPENQSRPD